MATGEPNREVRSEVTPSRCRRVIGWPSSPSGPGAHGGQNRCSARAKHISLQRSGPVTEAGTEIDEDGRPEHVRESHHMRRRRPRRHVETKPRSEGERRPRRDGSSTRHEQGRMPRPGLRATLLHAIARRTGPAIGSARKDNGCGEHQVSDGIASLSRTHRSRDDAAAVSRGPHHRVRPEDHACD